MSPIKLSLKRSRADKAEVANTPSLTQRLTWLLLTSIALAWVILMLSIIVYGLYQSYLSKAEDTKRLAKILAHSATSGGSGLVASQVSLSMMNDSVIDDVLFYSIDYVIDYEQEQSAWQNVLLHDTVSFHQGVYANQITSKVDAVGRDLSSDNSQDNSQLLIGYINITLDLDALRRQWFRQNLPLLLTLSLGAGLLMLLIFWYLRQMFKPLATMAQQASVLTGQVDKLTPDPTQVTLRPIHLNQSDKFAELSNINQLIQTLQLKYAEAQTAMQNIVEAQGKLQPNRQSSSMVSNFQSMVIHELKSALEVIFGGMQLIDKRYMSAEHTEALNIIDQGVAQLSSTLNQIVQLDRIEKGQIGISLSELQPAALINELVDKYQPLAKKRHLNLTATLKHVDLVLAGDVKKIYSILDALLSNAIKYTETGGVTLDSRIDYFTKGVRWTVSVADTGRGINDRVIDNIFMPFFQDNPTLDRRIDTAQMGLGVVYKLTELLGGDLTAEKRAQGGAIFRLSIPLKDWTQLNSQRQLEGVRLILLNNDETDNAKISNESKHFTQFGAVAQSVSLSDNLIKHLKAHPHDVLLIAEEVPFDEVIELCNTIRNSETSYRTVIAWYTKGIEPRNLAILEAAGLDYVLDPNLTYKEQAQHIKSWVHGGH